MLRTLGLGLVAAMIFACGADAREPLTKSEYIGVVNAVDRQVDGLRLFDEIVNSGFMPCRSGPPLDPRPLCFRDHHTVFGSAWLRSERRLRAQLGTVVSRLRTFRPPAAVAGVHGAWVSALEGCAERLRALESDFRSMHSLDSADYFQQTVAREVDRACFRRFDEICAAFDEAGYDFTPQPRGEALPARR